MSKMSDDHMVQEQSVISEMSRIIDDLMVQEKVSSDTYLRYQRTSQSRNYEDHMIQKQSKHSQMSKISEDLMTEEQSDLSQMPRIITEVMIQEQVVTEWYQANFNFVSETYDAGNRINV